MSTEERIARIEEAIETLKRELRSIDGTVDRKFDELFGALHRLEVVLIKTKADKSDVTDLTESVSLLRNRFWILIGLLVGSGVLGASAWKLLG